MNNSFSEPKYFPHEIPIESNLWNKFSLASASLTVRKHGIPNIVFFRQLAAALNREKSPGEPIVRSSHLALFAIFENFARYIIDNHGERRLPGLIERTATASIGRDGTRRLLSGFVESFPPVEVIDGVHPAEWIRESASARRGAAFRELLLLHVANMNPAAAPFKKLHDDSRLKTSTPYAACISAVNAVLSSEVHVPGIGCSLMDAILAPIKASPDSIEGQISFIRDNWKDLIPEYLFRELVVAMDMLSEETADRGSDGGGPGPSHVLSFHRQTDGASPHGSGAGYEYPEYEHFSPDADWMSNVVLIAKMVYVWLHQLSVSHGYPITRLDQIPDSELDLLASRGFTGLWLIGVWERSNASQRIKQICGNPEAIASAYSLYDYEIAADLGGWEALHNLKARAAVRGIRMASDMVPNHTGIYSRWVTQHPDWFVQLDYPPFPTYRFNGENLSEDPDVCIQIEDGYWTKDDAAVVFRHYDRRDGRVRYIYHGNDGTSIPWNDTAQLNYLIAEVREAVIRTILHVARSFPIIRFDAAMTLAKKHYQRLWFPILGLGGGVPSRAEHGMSREEFDSVFPKEFWREVVDRVAEEAPGTLLLAEAFWLMEGYFVRTLGMHRVYNSAFMNMIKDEENSKYRQTIKNVLEFNPEVLKRFVNFMNNPDEKTAVEQFGKEGKYFGASVLLATMPGLPMFGHGQIEGYHEKYGMEYKRSYWDEQPDGHLIYLHEQLVFPLLKRRHLFSGSDNFVLYDFYSGSVVDENVFAYSNGSGKERALVLYHNGYSGTSGWLNESAAFAVKDENGNESLRRTTLREALNIPCNPAVMIRFIDLTTGLSYLRYSVELYEKGLYAELGAYQFHVFSEFREINDLDGTWSALCSSLAGRGVTSLDDEYRLLLYSHVNVPFTLSLEKLLSGEVDSVEALSLFRSAMKTGCGIADSCWKFDANLDAGGLIENISAAIEEPRKIKANSERLRTFLQQGHAAVLLTAQRLLSLKKPVTAPEAPEDIYERLGLLISVARVMHAGGDPAAPFEESKSLFRALLPCCLAGSGLDSGTEPSLGCALGDLIGREQTGDFVLTHWSGGILWFNKERFEILLDGLVLTLLNQSKKFSVRRLNSLLKEAEGFEESAKASGYRQELFVRMLAAGSPSGKMPNATGGIRKTPEKQKKPVRKKVP